MGNRQIYKDNIRFLFNEKEIITHLGHSARTSADLAILPVEADKLYCYWDFSFQQLINRPDIFLESKKVKQTPLIDPLPVIRFYQLQTGTTNGATASERKLVGTYQTIAGQDSLYVDFDWQHIFIFAEIGFVDQENQFYAVASSNSIGKLLAPKVDMLSKENEKAQRVKVLKHQREGLHANSERLFGAYYFAGNKIKTSIVTKECEDTYNEGNYSSRSN